MSYKNGHALVTIDWARFGIARIARQFRLILLALSFAVILGPAAREACGQSYLQNIGIPTFAQTIPVENGYIDLATGDLHIEIPLGSYPERGGHQFKVALMYDSNIWYVGSGATWNPNNVEISNGSGNSMAGWRLVTSADAGFVRWTGSVYGTCFYLSEYTEPSGTQHSFYDHPCLGSGQTWGELADDGTGFFAATNSSGNTY